ncbi:MAG: Bax inhibitor-1 family protein, partial [Erysipelotrichales bacterium]|nr:Bax inhibitor-1 family protein [Erysipelotrichales bacterium]
IGLTAYDMQKVKRLYFSGELEEEDAKKLGTYGAMELYLDFINIFLKVLRILGNRRSNN